MGLFIGNNNEEPDFIQRYNEQIDAVYLGNNKIWSPYSPNFIIAGNNNLIYKKNSIWKNTITTNIHKLKYLNKKFISTYASTGNSSGTEGFAMSENGVNWKRITIKLLHVTNCCYALGKYFVTSFSDYPQYDINNNYAYSTDGINWTYLNIAGIYGSCGSFQYINNKFIAIFTNYHLSGTGYGIMYSSNGITWDHCNVPKWRSNNALAYGNGTYVIVGFRQADSYGDFLYSDNGIDWNESDISIKLGAADIAFGNNIFIAVCGKKENNANAMYSYNGVDWNFVTIPFFDHAHRVYYYDNLFYVTSRLSSNVIAVTNNGTNWSSITMPIPVYEPYEMCGKPA
jgi:hypothetical protein